MADEEGLASQEAAVDDAQQQVAAPVDQHQEEEQRQPLTVDEFAATMGWKPKDQWDGAPEKWRPADEFLKVDREATRSMKKRFDSMTAQLETLAAASSQIIADKEAEINARWEAKIAQATEEGDTELAIKLAKERPQPQRQPSVGPDPQTRQWMADNPWFETHPRAKALAAEISVKLAQQGYDVPTQLKEAEAEVRERYPELFRQPAKQPPATQTAAARNPNPSNRAKGFADMPRESQQVALEFERLNGVSKEDFAKNYWANEAKKRVRA